jgi:hypothetical protein
VKLYLLTPESGAEACDVGIRFWGRRRRKKLAPSSILCEAKVAYYAHNIFEVGRFVCIS